MRTTAHAWYVKQKHTMAFVRKNDLAGKPATLIVCFLVNCIYRK